jgi:rod shape-determining protein MreC
MANGTWKIARRGNAQLPLVIVLALAVVLVLLGKAQTDLFDRARVNITDWMAPVLETVRVPLNGMERWLGSIGDIFTVYGENLKLKKENASLMQWRNTSIVLEARMKHYQELLHAVPDPKLNAVLARVIGRSSRPFLQTMILDAGKDDAARPGEAVMDENGMIGLIYLTGQRTSWVILLTDINSRIPVSIAPGAVQAILAGDNTALPRIDFLSSSAAIKAGDQVVSSGNGGLLPPGLPVGTIVQDGSGFRVSLLADAAHSEDVEVLNFARPPEELPTSQQLPAESAGLAPMVPPPPKPMPEPVTDPAPPKLKMPPISQNAPQDASPE